MDNVLNIQNLHRLLLSNLIEMPYYERRTDQSARDRKQADAPIGEANTGKYDFLLSLLNASNLRIHIIYGQLIYQSKAFNVMSLLKMRKERTICLNVDNIISLFFCWIQYFHLLNKTALKLLTYVM